MVLVRSPIFNDEDKVFAYAVGKLFDSLSKWEKGPRPLTLEISTSRQSMSKLSTYHRMVFDEHRNREVLPHLFYPTSLAELPQVNAVTELQFRRNDYFLPTSDAFRQLLGSLPAVKKIEYEQRGLLGRPQSTLVRPDLSKRRIVMTNVGTVLVLISIDSLCTHLSELADCTHGACDLHRGIGLLPPFSTDMEPANNIQSAFYRHSFGRTLSGQSESAATTSLRVLRHRCKAFFRAFLATALD